MNRRRRSAAPALGLAAWLLAACEPEMVDPPGPTGDLLVVVTTAGVDRDPDGYVVTLDGAGGQEVPGTGSVALTGLPVGDHTLALTEVSIQCTAAGNPRAVTVLEAESVTVSFEVGCDPVLAGAGDIARCNRVGDDRTADLLDAIPGVVFTAGDNVYEDGTDAEFSDCYDPTWGRHKARTRPSAGNHDYHTPGASGYYAYFGAVAGDPARGYYSYDVGTWHVVVLNSNIDRDAGSPQIGWLVNDLAESGAACTVAYWHHPRFSSGYHGNDDSIRAMWDALYAAGVEIVVNGHDHHYERFAPQTPTGGKDPEAGIRQFVVGTGGTGLRPALFQRSNSEVRDWHTHGVLVLALRGGSFAWEFVAAEGGTFSDSGSGSCH